MDSKDKNLMVAIYAVVTAMREHPPAYGPPEGIIHSALQVAGLWNAGELITHMVAAQVVRRVAGPRLERGTMFDRFLAIIDHHAAGRAGVQ